MAARERFAAPARGVRMIAFCYASGLIVFSRGRAKPGTLPITHGRATELRRIVQAVARHSYDGKQLIVPGLPEAANWDQRSAALMRFKAEVETRLGRPE